MGFCHLPDHRGEYNTTGSLTQTLLPYEKIRLPGDIHTVR
jgi:hypothetical protein